jgi:hypothetical protein
MDTQTQYIGHVIDRLGSMKTRSTRKYSTYQAAHEAAERLAKRHYGDTGRDTIDVETL